VDPSSFHICFTHNNTNNNNKQICIVPQGRNFRGTASAHSLYSGLRINTCSYNMQFPPSLAVETSHAAPSVNME